MTNEEYIKKADSEKLSQLLCWMSDCLRCKVSDHCKMAKNGYMQWLKEEHKDD